MKETLAAAALALLGSTYTASAEPTTKVVLDLLNSKSENDRLTAEMLISGIGYGVFWTEISHVNSASCAYSKITLSGRDYITIFEYFVEANPRYEHEVAGLVMVLALEDVFPCE